MARSPTHAAIEAVFRIEWPKLIAGLTRVVRDVGVAEELAHDALVAALEQWPDEGIPDKPGAWLMATAKHRAIDAVRRAKLVRRKHEELGGELEALGGEASDEREAIDEALDDQIGDDLLSLMFIACHPVLATDARVALTLRMVGGLTTAEIARAFLALSRRSRSASCAEAHAGRGARAVRCRAARRACRAPRVVLEVVYLVFNEGYSATAGEDWLRPALCEDALRLARMLAELAPEEPEVHGLVALLEIQASRSAARLGTDGEPVLLLEQDRSRWDRLLIRRGLQALERAERLGGALGPYALQAAIAACHARAATAEATDWPRIVALYDALAVLVPSPVVQLNRAVAVSMAFGPSEALAIVDALVASGELESYHLLSAVRGDLLVKLGRVSEARTEFERAASLTRNERERRLMQGRADACGALVAPAPLA
jgi:predicted RNA polymerase sigma factor